MKRKHLTATKGKGDLSGCCKKQQLVTDSAVQGTDNHFKQLKGGQQTALSKERYRGLCNEDDLQEYSDPEEARMALN